VSINLHVLNGAWGKAVDFYAKHKKINRASAAHKQLMRARPSNADLQKLMQGMLFPPPRSRNGRIPKELNDIVMRALAPAVTERYQRAGELLDDLLAARSKWVSSRAGRGLAVTPRQGAVGGEIQEIQGRLRARETPQSRFCWQCRKPLHPRADRCPFCGEAR